MAKAVIADLLLAGAVVVVAGSALGVLVMRDVFQKLHFVTPAAMVAPVLVALAVLVQQTNSVNTLETWLALLFVVVSGPVVAHATARAARLREAGELAVGEAKGGETTDVESAGGGRAGRGRRGPTGPETS